MAKIDPQILAEVIAERATKSRPSKAFELEKICFDKQLDFINDTAPWVTACCSRRSGKTEVCAIDLLWTAVNNPGVNCLYITLNRAQAERNVWKKLVNLNEQFGFNGEVNISKLSITLPNKSTIYLSGAKDLSEIDKFRGMDLKLAYLDEIQSFRSHVRQLIDEVLAPALLDYAGSLKVLGTPAAIGSGYFFDILNDKEWSHHSWTFFDNPFIAKKSKTSHKELLERELKRRGVTMDDPSIQREFYGRWVYDSNSLVFKYSEADNDFEALPPLTDFVIGVDIGFKDSDSISVIGWKSTSKIAYLVEELIVAQQGITPLAAQIQALVTRYNPLKVVMDVGGLGKKVAEELTTRFSLPIEAADKHRKIEFIELLNDALRTKRFRAKRTSRFAQDSKKVEWDWDKSTSDTKVVSDRFHSDATDSCLYAYRHALAWLSEEAKPKALPATKAELIAKMEAQLLEQLDREAERQEQSRKERDFENTMYMSSEERISYYVQKRNE